jgi:hypothetical protein
MFNDQEGRNTFPQRKMVAGVLLLFSFAVIIFAVVKARTYFQEAVSNESITTSNTNSDNGSAEVLGITDQRAFTGNVSFNINAFFNKDVNITEGLKVGGKSTFNDDIIAIGQNLDLGPGKVFASNVVNGISVGEGLSISGDRNLLITSTGVTSLQGQSGALNFLPGPGITISGLTISSEGRPAFTSIAAGTQGNIISATNPSDILTLSAGSGISITPDSQTKNLIIASTLQVPDVPETGWVQDANGIVRLNDSSANVGIGTLSPAYKLDIDGSLNFTGSLYKNGAEVLGLTAGNVNGQTLYWDGSAWVSNSGIYFDSVNNRLGIGTTTPVQALDVRGGIRFGEAGDFNVINTTPAAGAPSGGLYFGDRELCDSSGNCPSSSTLGGTGTANRITKFTSSNTIGNSILFDNGTNVGIGTTTPNSKLDVAGDINSSAYLRADTGVCIGGDCIESWSGITVTWGSITGNLSDQTDLQNALNTKENAFTSGTNSQYLRGDKTWQELTTTVVAEGTNKYYTTARFNADFALKTTSDLVEGANQYFTNARARSAISANGPLAYNTSTGVMSLPQANGTDNGYLSAADWIRFDSAASGGLPSGGTNTQYLRGDGTWQTLNTTAVTEGTNLYYTQGRFDSAFSAKTTTNLTEGSNLYFTNARARAAVSASAPLSYNASTGQFSIAAATGTTDGYLSAADWTRFDAAAAGELPVGGTTSQYLRGDNTWQNLSSTVVVEGTNLYYTEARFDASLATKTTSNLTEGSNLYFTNARARAALSGTAPITYNASTGAIGINQVTGTTDGYLSAADWTRFDAAAAGELPAGGTTSQYLRGDNSWQTLSTSVVTEGANLYYTSARFSTDFATKTTSDLGEGSNLYFTVSRARSSISATGPLDYNASTGVLSLPQANGTNDGYLSAADWIRFDGAAAGELPSGGTTSQYLRGDNTWQTLSTTAVTEGTNLYYTQARFDTALAAKTTTDLTEGTNLYYTTARARSAVSASAPLSYNSSTGQFSISQANGSTDGYLSAADWTRFDSAAAGELPAGGTTSQYLRGDNTWQTLSTTVVAEGTNLYYTESRFNTSFSAKSTTDLTEGTNLYYTTARARSAISGTAPITYNSSTGAIGINQASGTTDGYLTSADWTRFDTAAAGELPAGGTTSQYLRGDNTW